MHTNSKLDEYEGLQVTAIKAKPIKQWTIPEKIQAGEIKDILCWKFSGIFRFVTLLLEILEKTKLHYWKFHKILLHPLMEILVLSKYQYPWKLNMNFYYCPWKFHFFITSLLEVPHALSSFNTPESFMSSTLMFFGFFSRIAQ